MDNSLTFVRLCCVNLSYELNYSLPNSNSKSTHTAFGIPLAMHHSTLAQFIAIAGILVGILMLYFIAGWLRRNHHARCPACSKQVAHMKR